MPTRRELLALLLSAPLAAEACRRAPPRLPGRLLGQSSTVGHRLREAVLESAKGPEQRVRTAIVGAGPSGLAAAWRLHRAGERDLQVFELEPQVGGTSAWERDGVVPHPWGAHYVPLPTRDDHALVELLDEMGVLARREPTPEAREECLVREPEERVFVDGRWEPGLFPHSRASERDQRELERFLAEAHRWSRYRDAEGRPAFCLPTRLASRAPEVMQLDRLSAAAWLEARELRSPLLRWYLEYACRDDYGLSLETTSAWALLFYFAARAAPEGGDTQPFITFPEGNGRLVEHLASQVRPALRTGQLVTDVASESDGVRFSVLDVASGALRRWRAERLILALPHFVARRVVRPWREPGPAAAPPFQYGSWVVANLHLRRRPRSRGALPAWDNVIFDSPALGYVDAAHQTLRERGPTVWTWYLPLLGEDPREVRRKLEVLDHATAVDTVMADLERAHEGLRDVVERVDVWRWGHAMVQPRVGVIESPARREAALPQGRLHFAHTDLSGLALFEEALDHGLRAADEVLAALRGG